MNNVISGSDEKTIENRSAILFTILIVVAPILNQYQVLPLTYIEILSIWGLLLVAKHNRFNLQLSNYIVFMIAGILLTILSTTFNTIYFYSFDVSLIAILIRSIKYVIMMFGFVEASRICFNLRIANKAYRISVIVCSAILLFQYFYHLFSGQYLLFLIPGIPLNYNDGINSSLFISETLKKISSGYFFRPSSLFIEPAYFALFVVPWLAIKTTNISNTKDLIECVFISISVMLTTSTLGFASVLILWSVVAINFLKDSTYSFKRLLLLPFAAISMLFGVLLVFRDDGFITSLGIKIDSLSNLSTSSSLSVRLLRGLDYYKNINPINKIIGVGYGNLTEYYSAANLLLHYDAGEETSYMSGIFQVLNSFGLIGLFLYLKWLIYSWIGASNTSKYLLLVLMIFMLSSACFDSASYWLVIIYLFANETAASQIMRVI